MKLLSHTPLKSLDLSRTAHAGKAPTHLSRSDLGGILSHPRHTKFNGSPAHSSDPAARHSQLVEQTKRWVAQTFFGTLMKQMHESPFKSNLFDGGRGGQAFGQMYDQRLVDHMGRGTGNKLANAIVRRIEAKNAGAARAAYERQGAATGVAPPAATGSAGSGGSGGNAAFSGGGHSPGPGQRRPPAAPPAAVPANPFKNVRVHVATGR